jgi:hypothetical protein
MKQLLIFLLVPLAVLGQTRNTGRSVSGPFANRPVCSRNVSDANAHNGDLYNDTDDGNVYKCSGGAWWTAGRRSISPVILTNPVVFDSDTVHAVSNIYVDIRAFGAYATFSSTTCNTTKGSSQIRLGAASNFRNGEYATCYNAGRSPTVSTPSAPTVTPSVHSGGMTRVNDSGGATSYAYEIVAEDKYNGLSAASSPGTTSAGAATLGFISAANFSGCTRSNITVTCTTTATHSFVVGQMIWVQQMTDPAFNGSWITISPTRGTTVTFLSGWDTRNGAPTSTTPVTTGNVFGFRLNRISYTLVTNAFRYHIYGPNCPTTCNWLGQSLLPYWDDYGSSMMANQARPTYIPATAPAVAGNQHFTFQIKAGGGTTTLTASTAAGATISGKGIVSDVGPAILAAATAAFTGNTGSCVMIPNTPYLGVKWVLNSYTDVTSVNACIQANGTSVTFNNTLAGVSKLWGIGAGTGVPFFGAENLSTIRGTGFPLIYNHGAPNIRDLNIGTSAANGGVGIYLDTPTNMEWRDVYLSSGAGGSNDCTGMPVLINNTSTGFTLDIDHFGIITGTCNGGYTGSSPVPAFVDTSTGTGAGSDLTFENGWVLNRGSVNNDLSGQCIGGKNVSMSNVAMQNASEPAIQISGTCPNAGYVSGGVWAADYPTPPIAVYNYGGARWQGIIDARGTGAPSAGYSKITGTPAYMVLSADFPSVLGTNSMTSNVTAAGPTQDGSLNSTAITQMNMDFALGAGYPLFTTTTQPAAPTCSVISGTSTITPGRYTFSYFPVFQNGGWGPQSVVSSSCTVTSSGAQQITVTIPTAIAGALEYVWFYNGNNYPNVHAGSCRKTTTSLSWTYEGGSCGFSSLPSVQGGGPAGMVNGNMWAQDFILGATRAPTGSTNSTQFYMDSTALWPSFKPNGNRAYVVPGISGRIIDGHNLCADGTSGAYRDCLTAQIIASGTATLGTNPIAARNCAAVVTTPAADVATSDVVSYSFNAAPSGAYTTGLFIQSYVTPGNVNFLVCNPTTESLTPPGATLNWRITR